MIDEIMVVGIRAIQRVSLCPKAKPMQDGLKWHYRQLYYITVHVKFNTFILPFHIFSVHP